MTLTETEQGRMTLWDKALTAALNTGKDIDEAVRWAEKAVTSFEARFHADVAKVEDVIHGVD
jgi:hypothetical protein